MLNSNIQTVFPRVAFAAQGPSEAAPIIQRPAYTGVLIPSWGESPSYPWLQEISFRAQGDTWESELRALLSVYPGEEAKLETDKLVAETEALRWLVMHGGKIASEDVSVKILAPAPATLIHEDPFRVIAMKAKRAFGPILFRNEDVWGNIHNLNLRDGAPRLHVSADMTTLMRGRLENPAIEDELLAGLPHAAQPVAKSLNLRIHTRLTISAFGKVDRRFPN